MVACCSSEAAGRMEDRAAPAREPSSPRVLANSAAICSSSSGAGVEGGDDATQSGRRAVKSHKEVTTKCASGAKESRSSQSRPRPRQAAMWNCCPTSAEADVESAPASALAQRVRQCNLRCIGFCPGYTSEMGGRGSKATEQGTQLVQVWVGAGRQLGISARVLRV